MNDLPLLTPYWSSAFAKQMRPPTLAPYTVAQLCMGPFPWTSTYQGSNDRFSPPALSYTFCRVIFSACCKQCLTFPPFLFWYLPLFCATWNTLPLPGYRQSPHFVWGNTSDAVRSRRLHTCFLIEHSMWCSGWHFTNASVAIFSNHFTKSKRSHANLFEVWLIDRCFWATLCDKMDFNPPP